jgi:hypothetical protein
MGIHCFLLALFWLLNTEYRMSKDGFARAAQALAPRVAKPFLDQIEYIHSMFDVYQFLPRSDWTLAASSRAPK